MMKVLGDGAQVDVSREIVDSADDSSEDVCGSMGICSIHRQGLGGSALRAAGVCFFF